ncbi:PREDICTED: uncharacterized protein LOC109171599 [Ipomoea nil]|uniref:uncharacterized protein LOC109171599 n=1 Tax=Ipomoea nil TaxID=35883 RepID=UPI000900F188|nr:PREDICTED: uncharacterized protein LOC109171599 [Ipomoea nil]
MEYFREDIIKSILEGVGKPLKIDRTTTMAARGCFARAAVEIDIDKPLVTQVWFQEKLHIVKFEGLHVVCFGCGLVGHREKSCPRNNNSHMGFNAMDLNASPEMEKEGEAQQVPVAAKPSSFPSPEDPLHGSWMLVTRKKSNKQSNKNNQPRKQNNPTGRQKGNNFAPGSDSGKVGINGKKDSSSPLDKQKRGNADHSRGKQPAARPPRAAQKVTMQNSPHSSPLLHQVREIGESSRGNVSLPRPEAHVPEEVQHDVVPLAYPIGSSPEPGISPSGISRGASTTGD